MSFVDRSSHAGHDHAVEPLRPVAVYGTLRPPMHNYAHYLDGMTVSERRGVVRDQALYVRGLPYVVDQPGGEVVVDVMTIRPGLYAEVLRKLDHLEGYDPRYPDEGHYRRVERVVSLDTPGGGTVDVTCWLYVAAQHSMGQFIGRAPIVRDYVAYVTGSTASRACVITPEIGHAPDTEAFGANNKDDQSDPTRRAEREEGLWGRNTGAGTAGRR